VSEHERRAAWRHAALTLCAVLLACTSAPTFPPAAPTTGKRPLPPERSFPTSDIAKTDIDIVAEVHAKESLGSARLLMEKLYRRNPREWRKGNDSSMDAALARAFDARSAFRFAELGKARGADAIVLALKPEYAGDRVFAFGVGLASMIFLAYNEKTEFYLTNSFDPQKLYNSARNIEIAAWKLANALPSERTGSYGGWSRPSRRRCSCRSKISHLITMPSTLQPHAPAPRERPFASQ